MRIFPIAFDSLGVRSMATFIETDKKIFIDSGAALGPLRYGLPPHKLEIQKLAEVEEKIEKFAKISEIFTISHYHYDHYSPYADFYKNKILLIKNPKEKINFSQKERARDFLQRINAKATIEFSDNKEFTFGKTKINFSEPCFHGQENSRLGYVIMCSIEYGRKKVVHASDVQGPQVKKTTEWIINENPDILIISGYPTIFIGWRFSLAGLNESNKNLIEILEKTKVKKVILEHHLLRDINYREKISDVFKRAEELKKKILTAAEFLGRENEFLEAKRKELYQVNI
ncbi:MAG: MBL fold metallo-hydrolase [Candidatus Altiarchaeota archaeon]